MTTFINLNKDTQKTYTFEKAGKYVAFFFNLSGEFTFDIKEKDVDLEIYGLFYGKKDEDFVIKTKQRHMAQDTKSNLFIKGVFDGRSRFHYEGLIKIEKEGQNSHAYQKNQNIILSPDVFVRSEPFLEILANEVFCTHGSTTGKLSENELYYLQSRGIGKSRARKLLIKGFLNEIIQKIERYGVDKSNFKFLI